MGGGGHALHGGQVNGRGFAVGGALAGTLEILLFHPWDTSAKRLMVNSKPLVPIGRAFLQETQAASVGIKTGKLNAATISDMSACVTGAWRVILGDAAAPGTSASKRLSTLYPGAGYAMGYKACQRSYQYTAQPLLAAWLDQTGVFKEAFGGRERSYRHAVAGAMMGAGEVILLPLDSLKVRAQTGTLPRGDSLVTTLLSDGIKGAWRGVWWTAARNVVGSLTFFGGASLMKEHVLGLEEHSQTTWYENMYASSIGSFTSVLIASPFDVVKTRLQRQMKQVVAADALRPSHTTIRTGMEIARDMWQTEGARAFFKGCIPRCCVVCPKLMFSYTMAQYLYPLLGLDKL